MVSWARIRGGGLRTGDPARIQPGIRRRALPTRYRRGPSLRRIDLYWDRFRTPPPHQLPDRHRGRDAAAALDHRYRTDLLRIQRAGSTVSASVRSIALSHAVPDTHHVAASPL